MNPVTSLVVTRRFCSGLALAWITALALLFNPSAHAVPSWVEDNAVAWREATADPRAHILILLDECEVTIASNGHATTKVRKATKILQSERVLEAMLREVISPTRRISDLKGWKITAAGEIRELQKDEIIERSESGSGGFYYDERYLGAAFHDAKPGDIAAFEYRLEQTGLSTRQQYFSLADGAPARSVRWSLTLPKDWSLHTPAQIPFGIQPARQGNRFEWIGADIPWLPDEPYQPPGSVGQGALLVYAFDTTSKDLLDTEDWAECGRWAHAVLEPAKIDASVQAKAKELAAGLASPEEIAERICRFAVDDVRYVAVELGKGKWYPRAPGEILTTRFGDCKDKTTLARALLASVGISSWAVLIGARRDILPEVPSPFQFDHVILGLPTDVIETAGSARIEERGVFLFDATAEKIPWGSLPGHLRGKRALVARAEGGQLIRTPKAASLESRRATLAKVTLRPDGTVAGTLRIEEFGPFARTRAMFQASASEDQVRDHYADALVPSFTKARVGEVTLESEADSAIVTATFEAALGASSKGGKLLIPACALRSHREQEVDVETRHHPLWLGAAAEERTETEWILPASWRFETKKDQKASACAGGSCEWSVDANGAKALHSMLMISSGEIVSNHEVRSVAEVLDQAASGRKLLLIAKDQP